MANYDDGTIQITEGSNLVVGTGTAFKGNVRPGQYLGIAGICRPYQVQEVVDDTNLVLTRIVDITGDPTTGLILWEQGYSIVDSFTPNLSIPIISQDEVVKQPRLVRVVQTIDQAMATVIGWQQQQG